MKAYVCSIVAALLCAGCNAAAVAPQPSGSPSPPITLGRGSLAVINRANPNARRVWVFPPDSDQFKQELLVNGSEYRPNSLAFDRRGHLYIGINNAASGGSYHIVDVEAQKLDIVREIRVPQWENSSVAVDDRDNLYVNTKAFVGGDIKIYRDNKETSPYIEIKDHHSPLTMLVTHDALWVGYEGAFSDALARYRLRSKDRTWFQTIGANEPLAVAANADGSLLAAFIRTKSTRAVEVYDVKTGKLARTLLNSRSLEAMTSDGAGHIYVSENGRQGVGPAKIHLCTFRDCTHSFEPNATRVVALAVNPVDGMLYLANNGKSAVDVYNPETGNLVRSILVRDFEPSALAIEP